MGTFHLWNRSAAILMPIHRFSDTRCIGGLRRIHDEMRDIELDVPSQDIPQQREHFFVIQQFKEDVVFDDGAELRQQCVRREGLRRTLFGINPVRDFL